MLATSIEIQPRCPVLQGKPTRSIQSFRWPVFDLDSRKPSMRFTTFSHKSTELQSRSLCTWARGTLIRCLHPCRENVSHKTIRFKRVARLFAHLPLNDQKLIFHIGGGIKMRKGERGRQGGREKIQMQETAVCYSTPSVGIGQKVYTRIGWHLHDVAEHSWNLITASILYHWC